MQRRDFLMLGTTTLSLAGSAAAMASSSTPPATARAGAGGSGRFRPFSAAIRPAIIAGGWRTSPTPSAISAAASASTW